MNHQHASLQLYLGLLPKSNKFGIIPCLRVHANCRMMSLYMLGYSSRSSLDMNVSRPQQRAQPTEKCGSPAERVTLNIGLGVSKLEMN